MNNDPSIEEINRIVELSNKAFKVFRNTSLKTRAILLYTIAEELYNHSAQLISITSKETHLEKSRLEIELKRTMFQLRSYGEYCEQGIWLEVRIDTADDKRQPPKQDLRKMMMPLGPVVVFGASNFPFAYSTAGGDTACALAAGCSVIVKAHPAHPQTSSLVASIIQKAIEKCDLPKEVFSHMYGVDFTIGKTLVQHPLIKAVGFTGSFSGGKALYDLAQQRAEPIPVFAEMGSVNPVFIMPEKLKDEIEDIALRYAISITQSAGQFCTNPGLLIAIDDPALQQFKQILAQKIIETKPVKMLHQGIASSYKQKREAILKVLGVGLIGETQFAYEEDESIPTLTEVPASLFKADTKLSEELFGPFSMIVRCKDIYEMIGVAEHMQGQLTCSLMATNSEIKSNTQLVDILKERCGRLILNGVPTGVEVALAMHHGGPFPATTDNRFTAVGADGIKRFARPICFQNWDQHLLPEPLQDENPLQIWRVVNNELTKNSIINTSL